MDRSRLAGRILNLRGRHRHSLAVLRREIKDLDEELRIERLKRVSAQMGLVNYMTEAGLGHRIGYDPRADKAIQQEIREGKLPPISEWPVRKYAGSVA